MIGIGTFLDIVRDAGAWIDRVKSADEHREAQYQEALRALLHALNKTRIYIGVLEHGSSTGSASARQRSDLRNHEKEEELSLLWTEAAVLLQQLDRDLAERCLLKGDYWANPDDWEEADIAAARIGIDQVFEEGRELLASR